MLENKILCGNSYDILKTLPDNSISTVTTSPPYFGLRNYHGGSKEIGQETSINEYLDNLILVFGEVKRVLRNDGGFFLNIGDCYSNAGNGSFGVRKEIRGKQVERGGQEYLSDGKNKSNTWLPHKCLLQIPSRLSIRMTDEQGWILRNTICWHKPNVMPQSVRDRFVCSWEYLFFFTKQSKYYFNRQYEPLKSGKYNKYPPIGGKKRSGGYNPTYSGNRPPSNDKGRIMRDVWSIPTKGFRGNHCAGFPEKLVETPILACSNVGDIILDPFCGSGTSCVIAKRLGRRWIGIDLNQQYVDMAKIRLDETSADIPPISKDTKVVMSKHTILVDDGEIF